MRGPPSRGDRCSNTGFRPQARLCPVSRKHTDLCTYTVIYCVAAGNDRHE